MKETFTQTIQRYIESLHSILYIEDYEYDIFNDALTNILVGDAICMEYNPAFGYIDFTTKTPKKQLSLEQFLRLTIDEGYDREVYLVLKDIDDDLKNPVIISLLKTAAERNFSRQNYSTTIFILTEAAVVPMSISKYSTVIPMPLPDTETVLRLISSFASEIGISVDDTTASLLAVTFKGMNRHQIFQLLYLAYSQNGNITKDDVPMILKEKTKLIRTTGLLELVPTHEGIKDVGGLGTMLKWIKTKKKLFDDIDKAISFGVDIPKGMLILGVPGCGKSMTAKVTANYFDMPLLRLDLGSVLGKYLGESEHNFRKVLHLAEAMSPCVLWLDEVEKSFAGAAGGDSNAVVSRMFGQFLYWMQEKESPVFVIATANQAKLPPEFFRKGRFDKVFYVDYPDCKERKEILNNLLRRYASKKTFKVSITEVELFSLAKDKTEYFSGADLKAAVAEAVEVIFTNNRKVLDISTLEKACSHITPPDREHDVLDHLMDQFSIESAR